MNTSEIKTRFPIFQHHPELVYLDSAATSLKPQTVIDAEREYLEEYSTNVGRGLYPLAEKATEKFEAVREKVARHIKAAGSQEIIFTSSTTGSINLAADLLNHTVNNGDNLIITAMEHHSNFLPWQELVRQKNADLRVAPLTQTGELDLGILQNLVDARTKIVAFTAVSNVLGTINPVQEIVTIIKNINPHTLILVDAAQATGSIPLDVTRWNADLVAFSAHKMFGPTGVGVLYGKSHLLEKLRPVTFGGNMVLDVGQASETIYKEAPTRFEAGTPNIGGVIALGAALDYIENLGPANIRGHEKNLTDHALKRLQETFRNDIRIIGPINPERHGSIISFALNGIHPHDIAHLLGEKNICIRAGHHCAAPLHRALGLDATTRISFSVYNNEDDVEKLIGVLKEIQKMFLMK